MLPETPLTPGQVRAARGLLRWSQQDLAEKAGIALSTVADFERGLRIPVPNNALAIQRALEMAGIVLVSGGVSHELHWMFMTEQTNSTLHVAFQPEHFPLVSEFLAIFGEAISEGFRLSLVQTANAELLSKLNRFVEKYARQAPHLHRLKKALCDLADGEHFLILPAAPSSSAEQFHYERLLHQLNHPDIVSYECEQQQLFGRLLAAYDITHPRIDRPVQGETTRKQARRCRFCGHSMADGATFNTTAHAIPAALGNDYLKLADECDACNGYFGREVEPALIGWLDVHRVFLGIKKRGSRRPSIQFAGGRLFHDGERMVVMSQEIEAQASGAVTACVGGMKAFIPQRFYQALCKIALSVIPLEELSALDRTVSWVRHNEPQVSALPKIAVGIASLPPSPSAEITLYIRKAERSTLPHVVGEFRLGCYVYVYVLPFSRKDDDDLIDFFETPEFKKTFRHYGLVDVWDLQDFSHAHAVSV